MDLEKGFVEKGLVVKGLVEKGIQKRFIENGLIEKGLFEKGLVEKGLVLMLASLLTLTLSILPLPYTPSPPPQHFPDLSSFLYLKCTMYIVFICNSHSFIVGQPIKTTYYGQAGPNYIVNYDFFICIISCFVVE